MLGVMCVESARVHCVCAGEGAGRAVGSRVGGNGRDMSVWGTSAVQTRTKAANKGPFITPRVLRITTSTPATVPARRASRPHARGPCAAMLGSVRLGVPDSRRTLAIYFAAGASFAALSARGLTVPLSAHELGASRFQVGPLFAVGALAAALRSMPAGVLIRRLGPR